MRLRVIAATVVVAAGLAVATPVLAQTGAMPPHDTPPAQTPAQAPPEQSDYPRLKIQGFGELNFASWHILQGPRNFSEGQFVLHMASALSPRATFFGELSFTPRQDAGMGNPPATG